MKLSLVSVDKLSRGSHTFEITVVTVDSSHDFETITAL